MFSECSMAAKATARQRTSATRQIGRGGFSRIGCAMPAKCSDWLLPYCSPSACPQRWRAPGRPRPRHRRRNAQGGGRGRAAEGRGGAGGGACRRSWRARRRGGQGVHGRAGRGADGVRPHAGAHPRPAGGLVVRPRRPTRWSRPRWRGVTLGSRVASTRRPRPKQHASCRFRDLAGRGSWNAAGARLGMVAVERKSIAADVYPLGTLSRHHQVFLSSLASRSVTSARTAAGRRARRPVPKQGSDLHFSTTDRGG